MDNGSGQQTYYQDTTGFGTVTAQAGSGSPFGYGGGNGCQTDADTGVVLMGHRYYDTRIGRFISQDPAGSGDNWYAYAGNSPTNEVDPEGLAPMDGPGSSPVGSPGYSDGAASGSAGAMEEYVQNGQWTLSRTEHDWMEVAAGEVDAGEKIPGTDTYQYTYVWTTASVWDQMNNGGAIAGDESYQRPGESNAHYFARGLWWAIKQFLTLQPTPEEWGNPFKGKTPDEIDKALRAKGYDPRGPDPVSGKGGYVNPKTGRSLHIDPANSYGEPPHVDVNRPRGYNGSLPKKKFDL